MFLFSYPFCFSFHFMEPVPEYTAELYAAGSSAVLTPQTLDETIDKTNSLPQIDDPRFRGKFKESDIEDLFLHSKINVVIPSDKLHKFESYIRYLIELHPDSHDDFIIATNVIQKRLSICPSKTQLFKIYRDLLYSNQISRQPWLEPLIKKKIARSASGVVVITVFTLPDLFSCPMDCHYCPNEKDEFGNPTQPRSYLSEEPGCRRATQDKFHPLLQSWDRIHALEQMGHIDPDPDSPAKLEFIVSGGTFNFYPKDYIEWFMTSIYYACNTYFSWKSRRPMLSLEDEQFHNESAPLRVIGLTIETRPDYVTPRSSSSTRGNHSPIRPSPDLYIDDYPESDINLNEIMLFRRYGITRVQVGIQHTDPDILNAVNRKCSPNQNKWGIFALKQNCFKTDIHIMPDLPFSSPDIDIKMIDEIIDNPDYQADQWKIYPTAVVNFTKIKEWYESGSYKPYAEIDNGIHLYRVLEHAMSRVHPWIRVNRVIRDIPSDIIIGGNKNTSYRDVLYDSMAAKGLFSKDIRQREVKNNSFDPNNCFLFVRRYHASHGTELFISFETADNKTLFGFIRLRFNHSNKATLPCLHNSALVRELHVYGFHTNVGSTSDTNTQHRGLGKRLLKHAEEIAMFHNFNRISIISGVGVRGYYRKLGYELKNTFMVKNLDSKAFHQQLRCQRWIDFIIPIIIGLIFTILIINILYWFYYF